MNIKGAVKVAAAIVLILAAAPFLLKLLPEALTMDTIRSGFEASGYTVMDFTQASAPQLEAVEQANFTLTPPAAGASPLHVSVYRFDHEGKLKKQYEFNRPDAAHGVAQAFVQTSGLGPTRQPTPVDAAINGRWLMVVTGADKASVQAAAAQFKSL
jgi:hypothetical protein